MTRNLDLERLSTGDAVVVEVQEQNEDSAIADTEESEMKIVNCDTGEGNPVQAEILDIDYNTKEILAIPKSLSSPVEDYSIGDVLTVSVDQIEENNAHVSLGPKSNLKIIDYDQKLDDISVVVTSVREQENTVLAKRHIKIDDLSQRQLVEVNQTDTVELRLSPDISIKKINVYISHLVAGQNWDMLQELLRQHHNTEYANINVGWQLINNQSTHPQGGLRDLLYTVANKHSGLAPAFGAEYLGSIINSEEYPQAWENNVKGNFAVHCANYGIEPNYSSVSPVDQFKRETTIDPSQLFVKGRESESRDHGINKRLRNVWEKKCAVCGYSAESRHDKTGIEGSHIYPVKYGGPDAEGNILPMCRNDHWAFENGWIAITDEYTIDFYSEIPDSVAGLLQVDQGDPLILEDGYEPDKEYIALHRRIHGFDRIAVGHRFPIVLDNVVINGVRTTLPSGDKIVVPYDSVSDVDSYSVTVVVTDIDENKITARPIGE
jgi:hypothetical protein